MTRLAANDGDVFRDQASKQLRVVIGGGTNLPEGTKGFCRRGRAEQSPTQAETLPSGVI